VCCSVLQCGALCCSVVQGVHKRQRTCAQERLSTHLHERARLREAACERESNSQSEREKVRERGSERGRQTRFNEKGREKARVGESWVA